MVAAMRPSFPPVALFLLTALTVSAGEPAAQTIGTMDFFGLRQFTETEIRAHLNFKEGDPFPRESVFVAVRDLEKLPGIQHATLAPITTDGSGQVHLFIGIQETGSKGFVVRAKPTGEVRLAEPLAQAYRDSMALLRETVKRRAPEDETSGHSLSSYPPMRQTQEVAIALMKDNVPAVKDVLKNSSSTDDRTAAAWLLGYAPDKAVVTADLVDAARDPNSSVRNNATRALGAIAVLAAAKPELGVRIDPTVFIEMLDSVTWTDRNKAAFVLDGLTKTKSPELFALLRQRALPDLNEMARWKSKGHEMSAAFILGRIAGWSNERTMEAFGKGRREDVIAAAVAR